MTSGRSANPIEDLFARFDQISEDRCDLTVLLKDEWRHKIVARDDLTARTMSRQIRSFRWAAQGGQHRPGAARSLSALALAAFHTALSAYGQGSKSVVAFLDSVGMPAVKGRRVLPTIVDHTQQAELTCGAATESLRSQILDECAYQPVDALLNRALFDTALVVSDRDLTDDELPATPLTSVVQDDEAAGRLRWTMVYAADLFDEAVIGGILDVVQEVFHQYLVWPERLVREVGFIPERQQRQLARWNAGYSDFPGHKRLNELFEDCAAREPHREAVIFRDRRLTYQELDERSNQLAHFLRDSSVGVSSGDMVGLCLDKSDLGVLATFAIWKAGAAYVPIDLSYPADRVRHILADTRPVALITNRHHAERLREAVGVATQRISVVEIETALSAATAMPRQKPSVRASSDDLAYVTYTSGTTGIPKGVPKDHRCVVNSITDLSERYEMRQPGRERVALYASYVFEPHLRQTLIALINGQTLVVVPDDIRLDPDLFPAYLAEHSVTYLNATGSVLQHYDLRRCPSLRKLLLVGEELTPAGLKLIREKFNGRIVNEYAFTESAFVTAIKEFPPGCADRPDRSIGRPLRNVTWYVLSPDRKQLPIGAIGEIYIGGCGVGAGYLNQAELSAAAFFDNPFQSADDAGHQYNGKIYRTGDLGRILSNGEVEYMGRADFQLKINGVRIEPGEVAAKAAEYPGVEKCTVVARELPGRPGERQLVGYYVADPATRIAEADLLRFLEERLVRVMVPARMVRLESIPVNVNGKVDWRALPAPEAQEPAVADPGMREGLLETLRQIWSDVLGVPGARISEGDDFFRLGGQSISCILLIALIRRRLRRHISVEDVFRVRTVRGLIALLEELEQTDSPYELPAQSGSASHYDANGLQQSLVYHAMKREDGDDAYIVQSVCHYRTAISAELMEQAWRLMRRKFPSLRLRFEPGERPAQIIESDDGPMDWRYVDLSGPNVNVHENPQTFIERLKEADRAEYYKPFNGGLFRLYLVKHDRDDFTLIFSCHHIVIDGWSLPVLHDEAHRIYLDLADGKEIVSEEDRAYAAAQRFWHEHREDHVAYWMEQIGRIEERGDYSGLLNVPSRRRVSLSAYDRVLNRRSKTLRLSAELTSALTAGCAANEVTLHSVLQFVWHKALHAIGGGRTTVVGTIISGRNLPIDGIEHSVGLYINTLPLVVDHAVQAGQSVAEAVSAIQSQVNTMNARSVVDLGSLRSGQMKRQLFDTLLVLENYPRLLDDTERRRHLERLRFERFFDADRVDHPMAVVGREEGGSLSVTLWYASEIFDDAAVDVLLDTARGLFSQIAENMSRPVRDLEPLPPEMVRQFDAWNRTEVDFPAEKTLDDVFESAAAEWPDQPAVVYNDICLTYRELNEFANRLAHHLGTLTPLHSDDLIALVMDKSELMIAAILAVWKAGAAFVPIDPAYPDERVSFMLEDTKAKLVIANRPHARRLSALERAENRKVLAVEDLNLDHEACVNPVTQTKSTDLAYAIYTSGTTGRPKAVLVEHRGVVNLQASLAALFKLSKRDGDEAVLSFSNYVFDHFVEVLTDALLNGQKLVMLDDRLRADEVGLCRYMNDNKVTYLSGTPSVLSLYDFSAATTLRRIDAIGEDFTEAVFARIRTTFPHGVIINGYGPTEISITSHKRVYQAGEPRLDKSIGFPVANTTCYILDDSGKRVPIGGVGELYIGGIGVARGYLNRAELTSARFVDNPFTTEEEARCGHNTRLYRTGDLARWLPNGEIEYLGRTDLQVKIRGQRVELGEIETVLSAYPGVTRALVIAREHGATGASAATQKYLVGFYLSEEDIDEEGFKKWLRQKLPQALIPAKIIRIADIPVTPSGKLDVKRLPETGFTPESAADYQSPATDVELRILQLWARVLGCSVEHIGVNDDFFALGGDSIRAMTLAQSLTSSFGCVFGVASVFDRTTVAAQAMQVQEAVASQGNGAAEGIGAAASQPGAPRVSLAQERLLFIDEFEAGTSAYNIPFCLRLTGTAPEDAARALRVLVRRHGALRTLLSADENGLHRQHILSAVDAVARLEIESFTVGDGDEVDDLLGARAGHVFRLAEELPVRAALITAGTLPGVTFLSLIFHHTCFDGWSWDIFRGELAALLSGADEAQLPTSRATYADFAVWQRKWLSGEQLSDLMRYWAGNLAGFEPVRLPLDSARPPHFDYRGREVPFGLDTQTTDCLRALARSARVSLYAVLLASWCLTLRVYTGQDDLVVGTPSANRGRPEFSGVLGLMANLLAVRVRVDQAASLTDYLKAVGAAVVGAQIHAELPFEQLVKDLGIEPDPSRHPVVQVNFTLLPWTRSPGDGARMSDYAPAGAQWTSVKFDLSVMLQDDPDGLHGTVTYAASLFEPETVVGFIATFKRILVQFAQASGAAAPIQVGDIGWSDPVQPEPRVSGRGVAMVAAQVRSGSARSLHELFEQAARQRPDQVAVVCGQTRLTFRDLNERADRLARLMNSTTPVRSGDLIALVLNKSHLTIIAILAVWKAGAGYVPIDPDYPDERIDFMLRDTGARLLLTNQALAERMRGLADGGVPEVLALEHLTLEDELCEEETLSATDPEVAYAIYTSGTSGRPKAVLVTHRNGVSFHESLASRYFDGDEESGSSVLFLSNYVFDFSVEQIALSILSGGKLVIPPSTPATDLHEYAEREQVTYLSGTPTQIQQLDLTRFTHLRAVLVAGEMLLKHHYDHLRNQFSGPIYNAYGTTETTVYNTVRRFGPDEEYRNDLGEPLGNTRLYVLDDALKPLPTGAAGEVHIAGECVSAGYLNLPELTAGSFITNHLQTDAERQDARFAILYKTGDLARRRDRGELQYLGRRDMQVKIRGLRIEPGEIEAAMSSCPGVKQCAVVVHDDAQMPGHKRLVAYYTPEEGASIDDAQVLALLRAKLPASMVPSFLVRMDQSLPMTINGKLDTDALPRPELSAGRPAYVAPRSRLEAQLCRLWREQLLIGAVGIDDDFFRTGGDSITALRLASRIQREIGLAVSVKDIFDFPTLRAFCDNVVSRAQTPSEATPAGSQDLPQEPLVGDCPLLPVQRWFFNKPLADRARWNQDFAVRTRELDVRRLRDALAALVDHHDAFRLRYRVAPGAPEQFYAADVPEVHLHTLDVRGLTESEVQRHLQKWQSGFDLERGPLWCAGYLHGFEDGSARIWFSIHHLIVDVVSWRIIAQDLEILYHGGTLGRRGGTVREWARAVQNYEATEAELRWWAQIESEVATESANRVLAVQPQAAVRRERFALSAAQTRALLTDSTWAYDTEVSDLLLTAVGYALRALTGRDRNHVTVEGHGRELIAGAPDVRDSVGWFTTMHPVPTEAGPDAGRSLVATKANRSRVPHHGIGYGATRGTYGAAVPLPPVSFNYLGRFAADGESSVEGAAAWRLDATTWAADASLSGESASESALDITMSCVGEELVTLVDSRLEDAATRRFAAELEEALAELIVHTTTVARAASDSSPAGAARPESAFIPYILVNEDAPGGSLFVLPPGEGGAESYLSNIARQLGGHRLVLFNNLHLHDPGESFEALASYYVEEVLKIQPAGPYSLLGWSFGGVLSVEMANQLARKGYQIANLFLIDPYFNVRKAVADIGMPEADDLLDPINYRYQPTRVDLDRLSKQTSRVVLFKAGEPNDVVISEAQRRLFIHYLQTPYNNLDTLLPGSVIRVKTLMGRTHHSWVLDRRLVEAMGRLITEQLETQ